MQLQNGSMFGAIVTHFVARSNSRQMLVVSFSAVAGMKLHNQISYTAFRQTSYILCIYSRLEANTDLCDFLAVKLLQVASNREVLCS